MPEGLRKGRKGPHDRGSLIGAWLNHGSNGRWSWPKDERQAHNSNEAKGGHNEEVGGYGKKLLTTEKKQAIALTKKKKPTPIPTIKDEPSSSSSSSSSSSFSSSRSKGEVPHTKVDALPPLSPIILRTTTKIFEELEEMHLELEVNLEVIAPYPLRARSWTQP